MTENAPRPQQLILGMGPDGKFLLINPIEQTQIPLIEAPPRALAHLLGNMATGREVYAEHMAKQIEYSPIYLRPDIQVRSNNASAEAAVFRSIEHKLIQWAEISEAMESRGRQGLVDQHGKRLDS
jgi:hypothetical protein